MQVYLIGYIIACTFAWLSLDVRTSENVKRWMFSFFSIALLIFCASRGIIDRDHQNYLNIYRYVVEGSGYLIEPTYYLISNISNWIIGGPLLVFVLYAIIGLNLKVYTIKKYSILPLVSLLVYFSNYYFLHEMTQMRAGISIGFALIAINSWLNGNKSSYYFFLFISFLFHYSALIFLIIPFMPKGKISKKEILTYTILISFVYVLFIINFGFAKIFSYIPIGFVQEKFHIYNERAAAGEVQSINAFSVMQMIKLTVAYCVYIFAPKDSHESKFFNVMLRFYIFSAICWVMFFDIPVFAVRLSDIFGISEIFIIPYLIYLSRKRFVGLTIITMITSMIFFINVYHNELLLPYVPFWAE